MRTAGGVSIIRLHRLLRGLTACGVFAIVPAFAQNCIVQGTYSSTPGVAYDCAFGVVSFNYTAWTFTNLGGGNITVAGSPAGSPPTMLGTINCADSTFQVSAIVTASCTETYALQGTFSSDTSWSGTFHATFTGSCFDCLNRTVPVSGTTGHVTGAGLLRPTPGFSLEQNYPNPFNPTTRLTFSIARAGSVVLEIYNLLGERVETLLDQRLPAGPHSATWEPHDLPPGIYFYRLQAGGLAQTRPLVYLK